MIFFIYFLQLSVFIFHRYIGFLQETKSSEVCIGKYILKTYATKNEYNVVCDQINESESIFMEYQTNKAYIIPLD